MIEKALGATSTRDISLPRHAFFCLSQTSRSGQLRALPNGTAKAKNSLAVPARRVRRRCGEPLVVKQLVVMPVGRGHRRRRDVLVAQRVALLCAANRRSHDRDPKARQIDARSGDLRSPSTSGACAIRSATPTSTRSSTTTPEQRPHRDAAPVRALAGRIDVGVRLTVTIELGHGDRGTEGASN
jgi:hypothetical protein